jgi:hypothetical protein
MTTERAGQCSGKKAFTSARLAHQVARRRERSRGPSSVYRCVYCGNYHMGTPMKPVANAKRKRFYETENADG